MQVINDLSTFKNTKTAIVTQGTFDGVHSGHAQILSNIVSVARESDGSSILITFHPHPRHVLFNPDNKIQLLTSFDEKVELLSKTGLDYLIVLPFDEAFSKMDAFHFVRDILVHKIGMNKMIVGYDHRFGRNREGSFQDLIEYSQLFNYEVSEIPPHDIDEAIVSSTKIRSSLLSGDLETATSFLGRKYSLFGKVIHGKNLGHELGYPTANLDVRDPNKLIPLDGVYAVEVEHRGKRYTGMLNIGNNPTIEGAERSIEVHIFDFNKDIYDEELKVDFVKRMRDEIKFNDLVELKEQLKSDEIIARNILEG
ncbi:MAG: bifunctional riboflavin kinase/FAD synthetase [Flavobacteriales bacterium]|nr:bifunctional riboflavin kinase/FAD synthetase [Flavobacteriales bacterium]